MTIETGVVKGNIDRVTAEIRQFIADAESKGHTIDNLKAKFDQLQLRAESFLKHLGQLDEAEVLQSSATEALQSSAQSPMAAAEPMTSATPDEVVEPADSEPASDVLSSNAADAARSQSKPFRANDNVMSAQMVEQPQSASDLDELRMQLDTIQVQLSEVLLRLDQLTGSEPTSTSNEGDLIDQALKNPGSISPNLIKEVMVTRGEDIMKRNEKIRKFWQASLNQMVFNDDQKKVLDHLYQYQTRLHSDESSPVLPSPWGRGMEDLFSD